MPPNPHHATLTASGLPIRFATQQAGRARVYAGDVFEEFYRNWNKARVLAAIAPFAKPGTHLDQAMERLVERLSEAHALFDAQALTASTPATARPSSGGRL